MTIRKQVNRFWKVFCSEQKNLEKALGAQNTHEVDEIVKILHTYFEELCNSTLEVGQVDDFYEITFHSNQDRNAQLICVLLKDLAPASVKDRWIINAFLPPLSDKALNTILKIKDQEYTPEDFVVYYEIDEINKCFNVALYCDAFEFLEPNKANEIAIYMMQLFVGDCALEAYINSIEVVDVQRSVDHARLPHFYEVLVDIVNEYEWPQYNDPTMIYRVFQLREEKIEESVRKDMKMIFTTHPVLLSEVLEGNFVTYHEFFDYGGEFGYLYFENTQKSEADAIYRQHLEKKLQDMLYPLGIAKTIGGAIGTKYSYVDLAIYDKEAFLHALEKINQKLSVKLQYQSFE